MKAILRGAAVGLALASFGIASAASAATATAPAEADILAALNVTLDSTRNKLDFGAIAESGAGGTVTLTPAGALTCGSGLVCSGTTGTPNFDIVGAANAAVNISVPASVSLTGPSSSTMSVSLTTSASTLTLSGTGTGTFDVGGTLTVAAGQTAGAYTGNLTVTVVYP